MTVKRTGLTDTQKEAAARLKRAFKAKKKALNLTYESTSSRLGWSSSVISQYLNASIALNMEALIKICSLLDEDARRIYPELFDDVKIMASDNPKEIATKFYMMSQDMQDIVMRIINAAVEK